MSKKVEFDDVRRAIMRRVMVVIDVPLSPPTPLVRLVGLVEGTAAEACWLPMADKGVYR